MAHEKKGNKENKRLNASKKMGAVKPLRDLATGMASGVRLHPTV